ncbi:MAG: tautomerase family protein [Chitinispirillaceae bacterium]|nr:tautomerase family protein [Chitinispirillaceae bacterium]
MPIAHITTMKGALSEEQKRELHRRFADLMVEIEGKGNEELRKYVILSITEVEPVNISIGGRAASKEFVERMAG